MNVDQLRDLTEALRQEYRKVVQGQEGVMNLLLTALLCRGHVLLEGVPGTAKTLIAQTFASSLSLDFNRIQFTPDLMPGDVLGTNLFDFQSNQFHLNRGPVFTEILLADEINRTAPKTQAALLQAMQERTISLDGEHHALSEAFMVIATQNPIEQEGTYPLPEAQLDRFLFKIVLDYPSRDEERRIVAQHSQDAAMPNVQQMGVEAVLDRDVLAGMRELVRGVRLADELVDYIVDIVRATREEQAFYCGASPRSANMLASAARGWAALAGRDYVLPDDIKDVALPTLAHRVLLAPGAELEGTTPDAVLNMILDDIPAPR